MPASRFGTPRSYPCAPTFSPNSFRLIQFRKNASANPLVSHSFKTKDLKPFRFTHFQKKGGGTPAFPLGTGLLRPLLGRISSSRFGRRTGILTEHRSRTTPLSFPRSEEHTSELQSRQYLVCRLLLEK